MRADAAPPHLTYAVADLHGRLDLLEDALAVIATHAGPRSRTIVFLGDYVDRGPQSAAVVERLAAGPPGGEAWICLKGNHEAMMAMALRDPDQLDLWIENGGGTTIASYRDRRDLLPRHLAWIEGLDLMRVDTERVFVHAGVDPGLALDAQSTHTLLWKRYADGDARGHGHRHVVHGHTPDVDGPHVLAGRTALDTLAWYSGRLVVAVLDEAVPGGPVDLLEVRAGVQGRFSR